MSFSEQGNELAFVKLRYKRPGESSSIEFSRVVERDTIVEEFNLASEDFQFASSVAGFGEQLRGSRYGQFSNREVLASLKRTLGQDEHGYRRELISLVELAMDIR